MLEDKEGAYFKLLTSLQPKMANFNYEGKVKLLLLTKRQGDLPLALKQII